jgi:hypothetical protein
VSSVQPRNVQTAIKVLLALLVEPSLSVARLAEVAGIEEHQVSYIMAQLRRAGVDIDYDFTKHQYVCRFDAQLEKSLLGSFAKKIAAQQVKPKPETVFLTSLDSYTVKQFAQYLGCSKQNVCNMIAGHGGQKIPPGWIAFRVGNTKRWLIRKADIQDGRYVVPASIKKEAEYIMDDAEVKTPSRRTRVCEVPSCNEVVKAHGLCMKHYQAQRRAG